MRLRVLELARAALAAIEASRARIDDLNVFPVPDGDTGTNLALTVRAIVESLEQPGRAERAELAHRVSRAALMGARGNSGVILSQIVRGAAEELRESNDLARALRGASDAAYRAVRTPVEGTMLTAIRELAEEAEAGSGLAAIVARGDDCVVRTQRMLPALAEAGVVDAGAAGLVEIVRGVAAAPRRRAAAGGAARPRAAADDRRPAPGALAVPLLHGLRRRGRAPRRRRARRRARGARRLPARRRRPERAQGARAHRRPRTRALARRRPRRDRRRRDRRHAQPDDRAPGTLAPLGVRAPAGRLRARRRGGRRRKPAPVRDPRRASWSTAGGR